jgi:hypothetical protein
VEALAREADRRAREERLDPAPDLRRRHRAEEARRRPARSRSRSARPGPRRIARRSRSRPRSTGAAAGR